MSEQQSSAGASGTTFTTIISGPSALAPRFHALFAGMERAHGAYGKPSERREEDGKLKGAAVTRREPVTNLLWERHLQSDANGIGIIPIRDDGTCVFGAVDVDVYAGLDHAAIASTLKRLG